MNEELKSLATSARTVSGVSKMTLGEAASLIGRLFAECERLWKIDMRFSEREPAALRDRLRIAEARIADLESQLPEGMKNCTFEYHLCDVGHGRIVPKNWIDHGCPWCRIVELEQRDKALLTKQGTFKGTGNPELDAALQEPDAEFEAMRDSLPASYWARYDLSAVRLGWHQRKQLAEQPTPVVDESGQPLHAYLAMLADEAERWNSPYRARALRAASRALDTGWKNCGRDDCEGGKRAEQPKPEPVAWREYPEFVPAPDTECLVEAEYGGKLFRAVDTWEIQREAPLEWSSATIEVGYGWSNHDDCVRRWIPISSITAPPAPSGNEK